MSIFNAGMIDSEVRIAAETILKGGTILYPTDTIWGIGCDATNRKAVEHIYRIKQRTDTKSMLVLINGMPMLETYLEMVPGETKQILDAARKPTTIVYPRARNLAQNLVAADGSVGIRLTGDEFCSKLIEVTGRPIVSTSANISGEPSPQLFSQISPKLKEEVDYVVNWRQQESDPSIPSAIIKLEANGTITILRS
jgi:L-threonylcarbamoyladenylate synthase